MGLLDRNKGDRPEVPDPKDQARRAAHKTNQQVGASHVKADRGGPFSREYLEAILEEDHNLSDATIELMAPMLNSTWKLANLSDGNIEEYKWLKRAAKKRIFAAHPPEGSPVQGEYRKFLFDDLDDAMRPLTFKQRHEIDQALMNALADQTRSKDMAQQEMFGKTHTVSEHREPDNNEKSGIFSFK